MTNHQIRYSDEYRNRQLNNRGGGGHGGMGVCVVWRCASKRPRTLTASEPAVDPGIEPTVDSARKRHKQPLQQPLQFEPSSIPSPKKNVDSCNARVRQRVGQLDSGKATPQVQVPGSGQSRYRGRYPRL